MKTYVWAALSLFAVGGCVEGISDKPATPPDEAAKTTELAVPAAFDWKTTVRVTCDFTAAVPGTVGVSLSATEEPFATVGAGGGAEPVVLDVPASARSLHVSYQTADGRRRGTTVAIDNGRLSFALPADAAPEITTRGKGNDYDRVIYVPATWGGWGTMMFEDLWPAYGDYDFNDFVLNYKIQLYANNKNMVKSMLIGLRVKAIGGTLPFVPRLRMLGVKGGEVSEIEDLSREEGYGGRNVPDGARLVQLNSGSNVHDPAVLEFRGVAPKEHRPEGSAYLNTEPGLEMPEDDLVSVVYFIDLRNSVWQGGLTLDSFDFFLADQNGREIHLGGLKPTPEGAGVYASESLNANTDKAPGYYFSNDRLVWAINIPENIPHAYEKTDFLKAYPDFAKWVQSGGSAAQEWYKQGEKEHLVVK